jgi:hypothetical protein
VDCYRRPSRRLVSRSRGGVRKRSKSTLCGRISRNTGLHYAWQRKIWVIEDVKELPLEPQFYMLGHGKPFCQVEVTSEEITTAHNRVGTFWKRVGSAEQWSGDSKDTIHPYVVLGIRQVR